MSETFPPAAVGDQLVAMLRNARDSLTRGGQVTSAFDIAQVSTGGLASAALAGLTVTCIRMAPSRDAARREDRGTAPAVRLDLQFLVAAQAPEPMEEQAIAAWALTAVQRSPVLAVGDTAVPLVVADLEASALFDIFRALGADYRLGFVVMARGVVAEVASSVEVTEKSA